MEPAQHHLTKQGDELTLKELVLKAREWRKFLVRKWPVILLMGLAGAGAGIALSFIMKPKYTATLTFVLEDNKSGGLGAYAGIASQFGIDIGSLGGGSDMFSGDNIIELLQSRLMVKRTLLSPVMENNGAMTMAEDYINFNNLRAQWKNNPELKDLHFPLNADASKFSLQQDSILGLIYKRITDAELSVAKPDKKLSFVEVDYVSKDERFAKAFTERLVKEATDFYIATKTSRFQSNVDKLQAKSDSILTALNQKTYSAAQIQDLNMNPLRKVAAVNAEMASRDKTVLLTMYSEVVKNLELTRMSMAQETPLIQVVDTPVLPLEKKRLGKLKGIVGGFIVGAFLAAMILIVRRLYSNLLA